MLHTNKTVHPRGPERRYVVRVPFHASRVPTKLCKAVKIPETSMQLDVPQEPMTKGSCRLSQMGGF